LGRRLGRMNLPIFREKIPHRRYPLMNQQDHSISIQQGVSLNKIYIYIYHS
jgi:hypothetical protein